MTDQSAPTTVITARWVAPVAPASAPIHHGAVALREGRIVALATAAELRTRYPHATLIERPHHILCPGLVNAHVQSPLSLLRSHARHQPYARWQHEVLRPIEQRWVDPGFVRDGAMLALAEMIRGGITCINDAYEHPDVLARALERTGLRGRVGIVVAQHASSWASDAAEYFTKGLAVRDQYRGYERVSFAFAPHSATTLDDAILVRVRKLCDQLEEPVLMPVHESRAQIQQCLADHGQRPLERLRKLGLVSASLQAVHAVHLAPEEMDLLAAESAHVVHCPQDNLRRGNGVCPLRALRERGINVALGTGSAAAGNRLDVLGEMRAAALLVTGLEGAAHGLDAASALHMATLGGARALGLGDDIGSIEAGKWADLVCVDLSGCATAPVYDPLATLVHAAGREHVSDVWVAGRALLRAGELIAADERQIVDNAHAWAQKIGTP